LSTSTSSVQLDSAASASATWKDEVNARLAAHRTRRTRTPDGQSALPGFESGAENIATRRGSQANSVAARVAERYAKAPSYSEMLAAQAAAARAAEAAAEAAAQAHAATQAVLAGLEMEEEAAALAMAAPASGPVLEQPKIELAAEARGSLITEIVDPFEEATVTPAQPLPAKLIEFPRELIATRKARPRLAEGPLRDTETAPDGSQLRIFEVEPESISKEAAVNPLLPEWHSIRLDAKPREEFHEPVKTSREAYSPLFDLPLKTAPLGDRVMAGIVDASLVMAAFLLFVLVFVACTAHPPTGKAAVAGAGITLGGLFVLYQWLFFSYSDATPGMRYAKIALCTFDDENPTRTAMRSRVGAFLLSAMPLGLGFLWSFFDEDHLGWHDRITRTYQRSYR
jgi:uncharacterized RDD family membrane protein YckC